jgi:hypothetical protein
LEKRYFDYEDRLFYIIDGRSGFVWKQDRWEPIQPEFAGRVWASGIEPRGLYDDAYGVDVYQNPPPSE